jgi:NAD(P)-dependent dehydrogenase (short-subunit alcohol dehydrogenase family)
MSIEVRAEGKRFKGRRIVVTGGASGIGLEAAALFHSEGAAVFVLERRPESIEALRKNRPGIHAALCDVSVEDSVAQAMAEAARVMGGIDGVANVAGIGTRKTIDETTLAIMKTDIAVNLLGPFMVIKAALPHLRAAGGGTIVNVSSGLALRPTEGRTAYGASKGGLITMSKAMAADLAPEDIRVNVVCPGLIDTPLVQDASNGAVFSPELKQRLIDRRLIRRMGRASEVADAIAFLSCDESSFMTASVMCIDGGGTMH